MRFLQPKVLYTNISPAIEDGILITEDDGTIVEILSSAESISPEKIEKIEGSLCPGFVNTHCHLELAHLKGRLTEGKGLPEFIREILAKRDVDNSNLFPAIEAADKEMWKGGIVAVGDISNRADTINAKRKSKIFYHTFIELFDIFPEQADEHYANGKKLRDEYTAAGLSCALVPHAPYTVSEKLFHLIDSDKQSAQSVLSIHNQETASENEFFSSNSGTMFELMARVNKNLPGQCAKAESSLRFTLDQLKHFKSLLLVHNTCTRKEDVEFVVKNFSNIYWAFCVNANLYIENQIPPIEMLESLGAKITLGTDSYASNWSLSIIDEINAFLKNIPHLKLENLLRYASLNGAKFLGIEDTFGSFEKGKKPGIVCLTSGTNYLLKANRLL